MIGTTKKTDYTDTEVRIHVSARCLPHPYRCMLDFGSLADTACHRAGHCRHYYHLPCLEAPA